jgi:hypothetical protein
MLEPPHRQKLAHAEPQPQSTSEPARKLVFISHANPEDNAVASWFATQLTLLGYEVWCDVRNTHGGESDFWLKVQKKIENDAAKFVFVLSEASRNFEKKKGVYKEVQAADNLRRDNFILPLRVQRLSGSVPILISPDLYIPSENWAEGLRELERRLVEDKVPRANRPDYSRIASWWPAVGVREAVLKDQPGELVSNVLRFSALPQNVHFIRVSADGNRLEGHERLRGILPDHPAHAAHGGHAISFGSAHDFLEQTTGFQIEDDFAVPVEEFLRDGCKGVALEPQAARNIATYLVARALERFLLGRGLCQKTLTYSPRKIWFPAYGLIDKNKYSLAEPGRRKSTASFVGTLKSFGRRYIWHFGIQPVVDLHTHGGVVLSPKAVLTEPYRSDRGEKPLPIDNKKALKKLGWWNHEWRSKILAFAAWLADGQGTIRIATGYQSIELSATPEVFTSPMSYFEMDDDSLVRAVMGPNNG